MRKLLFIICILFASNVIAQPSIDTININNNVFSITAQNIGTKSSGTQLKFDTFEDGTIGSSVVGNNDWIQGTNGSLNGTTYSDTYSHTGSKSYKMHFTSTGTDSEQYPAAFESQAFNTSGYLYADFWVRIERTTFPYGTDPQIKLWEFNQNSQFVDGVWTQSHALVPMIASNFTYTQSTYMYYGNGHNITDSGANLNDEYYHPPLYSDSVWYHVSVVSKKCSSVSTADGYLQISISDGTTNTVKTWPNEINVDSVNDFITFLKFGYITVNSTPETDVSTYWDDIYIDNSFNRVETGDDPIYENCRHREIQPTLTWDTNQISGTFNKGTFEVGQTVYFFVVDNNNVASPGKAFVVPNPTPVVGSIDNVVINNNVCTITGNFTSSGQSMLFWDDFEDGIDGNVLNTTPKIGTWVPGADAKYSTSTAHSGTKSCYSISPASFGNTTSNFSVDNLPQSNKFYASFWFYYDIPEDALGQTKIFQMHGDDGPDTLSDFAPAFHTGGSAGTSGGAWNSYHTLGAGTIDQEKWNYLIENGSPEQNKWNRFEVIATQSSAGGVADGSIDLLCNGQTVYSKQNIVTRSADYHWWKKACILYGMTNFSAQPISAVDDVFISNSMSRVEIGNNVDYWSCTHREIQPTSSWATDNIIFSFNKGSFNPGDIVYVFVVNENGIASPGRQITLPDIIPVTPLSSIIINTEIDQVEIQ